MQSLPDGVDYSEPKFNAELAPEYSEPISAFDAEASLLAKKILEQSQFLINNYPAKKNKKARVSALSALLDQFGYEHPWLLRVVRFSFVMVLVVGLTGLFWGIAGTTAGRALGFGDFRDRVTNLYYAGIWAYSEGHHDTAVLIPKTKFGHIEKVVGKKLLVRYYDDKESLYALVSPANVIIDRPDLLLEWAAPYLLKGIKIDFYIPLETFGNREVYAAVFWYKSQPINVELVEQGIGHPEKNPPTPLVSLIFSRYYFEKAFGENTTL